MRIEERIGRLLDRLREDGRNQWVVVELCKNLGVVGYRLTFEGLVNFLTTNDVSLPAGTVREGWEEFAAMARDHSAGGWIVHPNGINYRWPAYRDGDALTDAM